MVETETCVIKFNIQLDLNFAVTSMADRLDPPPPLEVCSYLYFFVRMRNALWDLYEIIDFGLKDFYYF